MTRQRALLRSTSLGVALGTMIAGAASLGGLQQFGAPYAEVQGRTTRYDRAAGDARKLLVAFMQEKGVPGLSAAVGVNGDIVWSEGMGLADVEQGVPVTSLTRFRSGSVSKAITSTAAAVLYQRGQLDYDAPIQKYVPAFPDKGHLITPRMLAGHLAGIKYYTDGSDDFYNTKRYKDVLETLEIFDQAPLVHPPGTKYFYTTYGTNLLGAAIQAAAGKPFPVVLQELVFDPLKMRATSVDEFDVIIPNRTRYYERDNGRPGGFYQKPSSWGDGKTLGRLLNAPFADNSNKWPGGGMITTPEDLVRYGTAHLQPGYLSAATLEMHFTPMKTSDGRSTNYAMNWDVRSESGGRITWSKGGSSVGGKSILLMFPKEKVVVAIQHNLTNPNYGTLPNQIADLFARAATASPTTQP